MPRTTSTPLEVVQTLSVDLILSDSDGRRVIGCGSVRVSRETAAKLEALAEKKLATEIAKQLKEKAEG